MVKIIGSSHIARDSVSKIKKAIKQNNPDIVAVELDENRLESLFRKQEGKIKLSTIKKIGVMGFLFTFIGKILQDKLGKLVGMSPGSDMKAAVISAQKVNAKVWLIDKNIQTIARDISVKISLFEKIKILGYIVGGLFLAPIISKIKPKKGIDLNKVPPEELIKELVSEFKRKFPKLYDVLIEDRNKNMAKAIKFLSEKNPKSEIIVVVGAGHISGIKDILNKKYSISIQEI